MKEITEIINVKVNSTEKETREAIFGGSVMPYVRISERYSNARKLYEDNGYKIVYEDLNKLEFTAEKKYLSYDAE